MYWMSAQVSIICVCVYEYTIMEVVPCIFKSSSKHTMRMFGNIDQLTSPGEVHCIDVKPKFKIIN